MTRSREHDANVGVGIREIQSNREMAEQQEYVHIANRESVENILVSPSVMVLVVTRY